MRKYQPIWEKIKEKGCCKIAAPKELHRRTIRGVIKEKDEDIGFKILSAEKWSWNKLSYTKKGNEITFTLTHAITLEEL
jgi:hypothetical protein